MTVIIDNAIPDLSLSISELTEASLDGNGVLDVLLKTMRLHLQREFEANRITGTAYASVYTESMNIFLQQAVQYTLAKSKLALELRQMEEQVNLLQLQQDQTTAQTRQIDYITDTQLPAQVQQTEAQTSHITKQELNTIQQTSNLVSQKDQIEQQTLNIEADTAIKTYQRSDILTKESDNLTKTGIHITSQTCEVRARANQVNAEVSLKLPEEVALVKNQTILTAKQSLQVQAQAALTNSQTTQTEAETTHLIKETNLKLPAEVGSILAQTSKVEMDTVVSHRNLKVLDAQTAELNARTNQLKAEVSLKLVKESENLEKQGELIDAQTSEIAYRVSTALPAQVANQTKQTALTEFELTQLKPKELELAERNIMLVEKQADVQEAQGILYTQKSVTEKAQTDNTVVGTGSVIDRQNQMMQAQADGFKRDAEQKVAKILIDTWSVRHNGDPDANPVDTINKLADSNIGVAVQKMLNGVGA